MEALVSPADLTEDDAARRVRIVLALATCTAARGCRATTISDIAREGRVSETVVCAHFRDEEHCLLELHTRAGDKMLATVRTAQASAARPRRSPRTPTSPPRCSSSSSPAPPEPAHPASPASRPPASSRPGGLETAAVLRLDRGGGGGRDGQRRAGRSDSTASAPAALRPAAARAAVSQPATRPAAVPAGVPAVTSSTTRVTPTAAPR